MSSSLYAERLLCLKSFSRCKKHILTFVLHDKNFVVFAPNFMGITYPKVGKL